MTNTQIALQSSAIKKGKTLACLLKVGDVIKRTDCFGTHTLVITESGRSYSGAKEFSMWANVLKTTAKDFISVGSRYLVSCRNRNTALTVLS